MKTLIAISLLVAVTYAGILPAQEQHSMLEPVIEGRITNGENATHGQFPYQVGLSLQIGTKSAWCGGTLISNRLILTAAHCTYGIDGLTAYLGALDIRNDKEEGQQKIFVSKSNIVVHASYNPSTIENDISLIKLPVAVEFNELIQPAALPKKSAKYSTYEGELVYASGWGRESDSAESVSQFLRYIQVPVMKQSSCKKYYFGSVTDKMICISTKGKKSTCNGDSGGPLVHKDGDVNTVIGATSFGILLGCEKGWPGVFTRVTAYLDWIEENSDIVIN